MKINEKTIRKGKDEEEERKGWGEGGALGGGGGGKICESSGSFPPHNPRVAPCGASRYTVRKKIKCSMRTPRFLTNYFVILHEHRKTMNYFV